MVRQPPVVVAALLVLISVVQGDPFFGESPGHLPPQPRTLQSAGDPPSTSAGTVDEAAYEGEQVAFGVVASLCILLGCGMTVFVCISASRPAPAPTLLINGRRRRQQADEDADYDNFARDPNGRLVCILDVNAPPTVVWGPGARHKGAAAATGGPGPGSPSPPLEPAWWRRRGGAGFKGIAGGGGVLSGQAGPAASPVGTAGNPSAASNRSNVPVVVGNPMQRAMHAHGVSAPASPPAAIVPSMPSLFAIDDAGGAAWGPPSAFPAAAVVGDGGGFFPVVASAPLLHPEPLPLPTSADQRHHFHPVPTTGVLAAQQQQQQPLSIYSGEGVVEGLLSPSGEAPAPEIGIPQHPPAAIVVGAAHVVMTAPPPDARDDDPRPVPLLSTVYSPGPGPSTTATSTTTHNPLPDTHSPPHLPMPPSARRVVGGGANVTAAVRVLAQRAAPMTDLEAALLVQRVYKGHKLRSLLRGWVKVVDDDGDVFFHNPRTGDVLWDLPRLPFMPVRPLGAPAAGSGAAAGRAPALSSATAAALGLLALLPAGAAEGGSVAPGSAAPPSRSRTPAGLPFDPHTDDDGRPLAGGWIRYTDGTGDVWYVQLATHETSWEPVYPPQQ